MPECLPKVEDLRKRFPGKNIQVDGGVGPGNVCQCAQAGGSISLTRYKAHEAGSNVVVAGTAVFGSKDPKKTIEELRSAIDTAIAEKK